ncbi:unnamed protein product [Alternaria alternata]
MDNILDAEQAWDKFCSDMAPTRDDALRYVRINPDIERQPPKLDEVKKVGELIRDTRKALKTSANRAQIARVTHILVAIQIPLPLETISEMRQLLYFRLPVCNIRAKRKDSQIDISLHIRSRDLAPAKYHISGFPRAVMRDNEPQSE